MQHPFQLTADKTTWFAIESALKFAAQQADRLGQDADFVRGLLESLGAAITDAEASDGCARF